MDWMRLALRHGIAAGRQRAKARDRPDAARGLMKAAEFNSALAATYLDDGVDQLGAGEDPAGPCERRGLRSVAREAGRR
jgi:hypothetical protein